MLASSGDNSQSLTAAEFLAGSNDTRSSQQYLQPNSNDPDNANSNTSKKKSMERISQLFQKKSKKKSISSSLTPSFSSVSLSSPPYDSSSNTTTVINPPQRSSSVRASVKPNLTSAAKDTTPTIANDTQQLQQHDELSEQRPSFEGETKSSQDDKGNDEEEKGKWKEWCLTSNLIQGLYSKSRLVGQYSNYYNYNVKFPPQHSSAESNACMSTTSFTRFDSRT